MEYKSSFIKQGLNEKRRKKVKGGRYKRDKGNIFNSQQMKDFLDEESQDAIEYIEEILDGNYGKRGVDNSSKTISDLFGFPIKVVSRSIQEEINGFLELQGVDSDYVEAVLDCIE